MAVPPPSVDSLVNVDICAIRVGPNNVKIDEHIDIEFDFTVTEAIQNPIWDVKVCRRLIDS